jgi:hypothetical protein
MRSLPSPDHAMHGPDYPPLQPLRAKMEGEWTPQMMKVIDIERNSLPIIWDADFLYGPKNAAGEDTYVLCEINVSSVFAIPDEAPAAIARLTLENAQIRLTRSASGAKRPVMRMSVPSCGTHMPHGRTEVAF